MSNELNTNLAPLDLILANVDPRVTVKHTGIKGGDFLAIDGRTMFWTWMQRGQRTVRLYATVEGDSIVFKGGLFGDHRIAASKTISSAERIEAHWRGYVANNEAKLRGRTFTAAYEVNEVR